MNGGGLLGLFAHEMAAAAAVGWLLHLWVSEMIFWPST